MGTGAAAEPASLAHSAGRLWLYAGDTDQILPISAAVQDVLQQCDGLLRVADIAAAYPASARGRIFELVRSLAARKVIALS